MVIEQKKHLLDILTRVSNSPEVREYEGHFLKRYINLMNNRQSFFMNRQKSESKHSPSMLGLLTHSKNSKD